MLEIKFEQPFDLRMEVMETDDHVPSMRVDTKIVISQFQHNFSYQGSFWIECATWSRFANALSGDLSAQAAVLQDISGYFTLGVSETNGACRLSWEFKKIDAGGGRNTSVAFSSEIDDSALNRIRTEFEEFPAWW